MNAQIRRRSGGDGKVHYFISPSSCRGASRPHLSITRTARCRAIHPSIIHASSVHTGRASWTRRRCSRWCGRDPCAGASVPAPAEGSRWCSEAATLTALAPGRSCACPRATAIPTGGGRTCLRDAVRTSTRCPGRRGRELLLDVDVRAREQPRTLSRRPFQTRARQPPATNQRRRERLPHLARRPKCPPACRR